MRVQADHHCALSRIGATLALVVLMSVSHAWGATEASTQPAPIPPEPKETLALADAVLRALERNLDITISRRTREIRLTDILFEQAKFDPTLNLSGRYDRTVSPVNTQSLSFTALTRDQNNSLLSAGIEQKFLTGADYDLNFNSRRTFVAGQISLFNPSYDSDFTLNLSQPLLRDFGTEVNRAQIRIAQNNARVEDHVFFDRVLQVISTVEQTYWELVFAHEGLKVAQTALRAAEELLASNRAKAKAGLMAIVDVLQAEAAVASRVGLVLVAEKEIGDQQDRLRQLLNPSEEELRQEVQVIPVDTPIQSLEPISLQEAIDIAIERRPEILQASKNIETSGLNVKFAKNQLLPSLALEGTAGLAGLGSDPGDMFDRNFSGDFYNWGGGLVLSYPLGNRSAWSQYRKRQIEARNAQASLQSARQQVIIDLKEAVRRVRTDFKRIETTRSARILSEKQLEAEQERLNVGLSTTRFVLDFQRDLAIAQRNELRAVVDYNKSLSNLARQKGTTLEQYGIELG
ncbi:MAG: TolC family protein [Nitrospirae bacterium]|nr:TolC family protein [Nitrospirota bacterium]